MFHRRVVWHCNDLISFTNPVLKSENWTIGSRVTEGCVSQNILQHRICMPESVSKFIISGVKYKGMDGVIHVEA